MTHYLQNTISSHIKTLEDCIPISVLTEPAIDIMRNTMKQDGVHDESHLIRVVRRALWFASQDGVLIGDPNVIIPSAILHDLVNVRKDSPDRSRASLFSANLATKRLGELVPDTSPLVLIEIHHAILAHSWSAGVTPETLEARAVQDADRLDALGALGLARLFSTGGQLGRSLFHPTEIVPVDRDPEELKYTLDHFYTKLCKLKGSMRTPIGGALAEKLTQRMVMFIDDLVEEIGD
jgi:uncharacterized protein